MEAKKKPFGDGLFWELSEDGTLTISGNGDMPEFGWNSRSNFYKTPWSSNLKNGEIRKLVVMEGVTYISKGAFAPNPSNDESLSPIREVILPKSLKRIGSFSFKGLNMDNLIINEGVEIIDKYAFYGCTCQTISLPSSLKQVGHDIFDGYARSWKGEIISLPSFMLEHDGIDYGISSESWDAYKNGIKDREGRIVFAASKNREIKKISAYSDNASYIIKENGKVGLMNSEGRWIINAGSFQELFPVSGSYLRTRKDNHYGVVNLDGKEIIPTSRGYTSIGDYDSNKGTFAFTKKGYTGFCDAQGKEISLTKLPPTAEDIKSDGGYASAVELMNGSTKYFKVSKSGRYGLTNSEGKKIIPCEMESLEQAGTGFLRFKLNGFYGIVNYAGKIIIPTDRGYTKIGDYVSFTKRFAYEMDGWKGECNNLGVQVSKIKVNKPVAQDSSTTLSSTSAETVIDFIFDLYMKQTEGDTFIPIPRMPEKENNSLVWEYVVRIELKTNSINYKIMLVDRMPDYKTEIVESYSLTPSSSIFAMTDERMQIVVDESGVYKGLQLDEKGVITIGKWRNDKFIDGWFFVPFSLYRDMDGELGENYAFQETLLKGINENKNFEHAQIGETDFNGKYNKLKAALQKYNWSKVVKE